jgi:hypothetical protein
LEAIAAIARGPVFDFERSFVDPGYFIAFTLQTIMSNQMTVATLGQRIMSGIASCSTDNRRVSEWLLDICYTGKGRVSSSSFLALARLVSDLEDEALPYSEAEALCVSLFMTASPNPHCRHRATQLFGALKQRFFGPTMTSDLASNMARSLSSSLASLHQE